MIDNIIDLKQAREDRELGWENGIAICTACAHRWIAVVHPDHTLAGNNPGFLQCPRCERMAGIPTILASEILRLIEQVGDE